MKQLIWGKQKLWFHCLCKVLFSFFLFLFFFSHTCTCIWIHWRNKHPILHVGTANGLIRRWMHQFWTVVPLQYYYFSGLLKSLLMCKARKGPKRNLQKLQAQIWLLKCTSWYGPSTYRMNGSCSIYWQTENAQIRLHGCTCWSVPLLFVYSIRAIFPCGASLL